MTRKEIRGTEWTCDGCGTTVLAAEGGPKPDGFYIPMFQVWSKGKRLPPAEVWACKLTCVRKGMENALQDALDVEAEDARQDGDAGR